MREDRAWIKPLGGSAGAFLELLTKKRKNAIKGALTEGKEGCLLGKRKRDTGKASQKIYNQQQGDKIEKKERGSSSL